jgi:hypothetical protein
MTQHAEVSVPVEAHQFDFWIGSWDVFRPDGRQVGRNEVEALFDGRVLSESWTGVGNVLGRSLNSWDAARGRWHQTWMDSTGGTLLLDGGLRDGAMVMEGSAPSDDQPGRCDRHRITWAPDPRTGGVRQLWEVSEDDGASWTVSFDGYYRRRAAPVFE